MGALPEDPRDPLYILLQTMVALSMVLVFLLALSRGESELDAKSSSPQEATEWRDPNLSRPGSCQPAPSLANIGQTPTVQLGTGVGGKGARFLCPSENHEDHTSPAREVWGPGRN